MTQYVIEVRDKTGAVIRTYGPVPRPTKLRDAYQNVAGLEHQPDSALRNFGVYPVERVIPAINEAMEAVGEATLKKVGSKYIQTFGKRNLTKQERMNRWQQKMEAADRNLLPRWAEDIIDVLPDTVKEKISQATRAKVAEKKALRGSKPE